MKIIRKGFFEFSLTIQEIRDRKAARDSISGLLEKRLIAQITITDLPELFRERMRKSFYPGRNELAEVLDTFQTQFPDSLKITVNQADAICRHTFDLLGSGDYCFGSKINWHIDFKSRFTWAKGKYFKRFRPAEYPGGFDIKVPWELSRCQHFVRLGQAFWFTNNKKYPMEFVNQLLDWIDQNPWPFGVNWNCTMDVAIRAINWFWGLAFFLESEELSDEIILKLMPILLKHGDHIYKNLENKGGTPNNHYLANLIGLFYIGILLPQFDSSKTWVDFSKREIEKEIFAQVYSDGVNFEASVCYHRLATELFISAVVLARKNEQEFSPAFLERLEKMLEFILYVTRPDGSVPIIGDNDNGRVHRLKAWGEKNREWVDHRYLLAVGAILYSRDDFAFAAGDQWEEALWLLGPEAISTHQRSRAQSNISLQSREFPSGGFYVIRHEQDHMVAVARPMMPDTPGGHAHNDILSFELFINGKPFLKDPGTYSYTSDYAMRNLLRSTAYHNAIVVDNQEQTRLDPKKIFQLKREKSIRILKWSEDAGEIIFCAEFEGSFSPAKPITHRRQIRLIKALHEWQIEDSLLGTGRHNIEFHWHFNEAADFQSQKAFEFKLLHPEGINPKERREQGIIAPAYGTKVNADHLVFSLEADLPIRAVTIVRGNNAPD